MYKFIEVIENIDSFKVFNKYLAFKLKENKYALFLNKNLIDNDNKGFFFFENSLCLQNTGLTRFLNLETDKITEIPITFNGKRGYFNNTYVTSFNSRQENDYRWTSNYVVYQLKPFKELYKLPHRYYGSGYRFENHYIQIQNERKLLKSLSLLTGEYEWEVDLGVEGLEIAGILGIKDTNLIVACTNKQDQVIWLALDVVNGKEIWRRHLQVSSGGGANAFSEDKTSLFNLHAGVLWLNGIPLAQGNHIFREINVTDGSIKREGILSDVDEAGLGVKNFTLYGDKIYFTARYNGSFGPIAIGVLDYETLSLLWWEEVQMQEADGFGNFFLNQPIQVSENKIYVLDKTHVLHIYQRDESVTFVKPSKSGLRAFGDLPTSFDNIDNQNMSEDEDLPF